MTDWPVPGQQRGTWGEQLVAKIEEELGERDNGLADHLANENNPHNVTAEQVGLGNVDNTADVDKPVSTAQEAAIDAASIPDPTNYYSTLRNFGGIPTWLDSKEAHLNDRDGIDSTGAADMGATITAYLAEYAAGDVRRVYVERGTYSVATTPIYVPGTLRLIGQGNYQQLTRFQAGADSVRIIEVSDFNNYVGIEGIRLDLNSKASAVGIYGRPSFFFIDGCWFSGIATGSTGIYAPAGSLYTYIRNCHFASSDGAGIDISDGNVTEVSGCYFGNRETAVKLGGLDLTVHKNGFETYASTEPAIHIGGATVNVATITENYFERQGIGVYATGNVFMRITNNEFNGAGGGAVVDTAAIDLHDANVYEQTITGNHGQGWYYGIRTDPSINSSGGGDLIAGNAFSGGVGARISMGTSHIAPSTYGLAETISPSYVQDVVNGHQLAGAPIALTNVPFSTTGTTTVDMSHGGVYTLAPASPATISPTDVTPNAIYLVRFTTAHTTLPDADWGLRKVGDETVPSGTVKLFRASSAGVLTELASWYPIGTAITQTYSTADRTLSAYTPDDESVAYTGAADSEAKLDDLNALRIAYENLRVFAEDTAQLLNAVVDDLQTWNLVQ